MEQMDITPSGVYRKYNISRADGQPLDPSFEGFVLRLDYGGDRAHVAACREAMWTYAMAIQTQLPGLALDIFNRFGPLQPEGWEHRYFKRRTVADALLLDQAEAEICEGRRVWVLVENDRYALAFEVDLRTRLAARLGRDNVGLAMHQLVNVQTAKTSLLRAITSRHLDNLGAILMVNPRQHGMTTKEYVDPRIILNRRLFMKSPPENLKLISVEFMDGSN